MNAESVDSQAADNTSGQGKEAVLPDELKGLNWGAFLLNWIWGLGNRTYIALLMFLPIVNVVMLFVLLFKGNRWAWANKSWEDVDHFRRVQRRWIWGGLIAWVVILPGGVYGISAIFRSTDAFVTALDIVRRHPVAVEHLGEPIDSSWWVSGEVSITGPKGDADLSFAVSGPKGEGHVYTSAIKEAGVWRTLRLVLEIPATGERFDLLQAGAGKARAGFDEGFAAYERGDYAAAFREWRPLAEQGHAMAQYNLGVMYDEGRGVTQDYAEAVRWYRMAADQGAAQGQNNLGWMYANGKGVPQDYAEAVRWYRMAADQGLAMAQDNLGNMYMQGRGVPMDIVEGRKWIEKAAEQGFSGTE